MRLKRIIESLSKNLMNVLVTLLCSLWLAPFLAFLLFLTSAENSDYQAKDTDLVSLSNVLIFLGLGWFSICWITWSFIIVKRFREGCGFNVNTTKGPTRVRMFGLFSVIWVLFLAGYVFLYFTIRMDAVNSNDNRYISSGASIFYMARSSFSWFCILLIIPLYKFFTAVIRRL